MPDTPAIRLVGVSKVYRLHGSQGDQLIDVLGLQRFGLKPRTALKEFIALDNISLDVPKGHRIGIVGRNGAGKTTLLKLICGNFSPTKGDVEVNGRVQALMSVGLGFHPEYTGRENVNAALQYNGLSKPQYEEAIKGIIEFCELGDFLDQPFKTYSLGMQARLMFAAATAIKPDILIVDEVLGAGDAYFVAKSKARVESMISGGCTMLLVSHSMQQVLELCDEAVWVEHGAIKLRGTALEVVKAYEESLHGQLSTTKGTIAATVVHRPPAETKEQCSDLKSTRSFSEFEPPSQRFSIPPKVFFQKPAFIPHQYEAQFPPYTPEDIEGFRHIAPGGLSRWESKRSIEVIGFAIQTDRGIENKLRTLGPAKFILLLHANLPGDYSCMYGIVFNDLLGNIAARIWSPPDIFFANSGERRIIELVFNPLQLGPGEYTIGITILQSTEIELVNTAIRHDQLSRSFICSVDMDSSLLTAEARFIHTGEWVFGAA